MPGTVANVTLMPQLKIFNAGGYGAGHGGCVVLCRGDEVPRWRWADCGGAGPPGAGAVSGGGCDRGGGQRPGGGAAVPGDADVGEPVAAGAGRRWPGGAGVQRPWWRPVQADRGAGA